MNRKITSIVVISLGLLSVLSMLVYANGAITGRLLSAQTRLEFIQQEATGLRKYYLFFRSPKDVPVAEDSGPAHAGDGTLPAGLTQEEFEFIKSKSISFPALRGGSLVGPAQAAANETVDTCNLPTGHIVEPWWHSAGENYE